jgi:hypothetical protein
LTSITKIRRNNIMPGHYGKMKNGKAKKMAKGKSTRKSCPMGKKRK